MYCVFCGNKLPENARFCSSCGARVENKSRADHEQAAPFRLLTMKCTACGSGSLRKIRRGEYRCEHCGTAFFTDDHHDGDDPESTDAQVAVLLKEAEEYEAKNDLRNELLTLSKALPLAPERFEVLYNLARCCNRLDFHDQALELFQKADALYPDNPEIIVMMGTACMDKGNAEEAKAHYERVLSMIETQQVPVNSSTAAVAYVSCGFCLGRLGDQEAALKYFSMAKEKGYSQSGIDAYCRELGLDPGRV